MPMSRPFPLINIAELKTKIRQEFGDRPNWTKYIYHMTSNLEDIYVSFDLENLEFEFETYQNGLTVLSCFAAGDWEETVYYFFYWDGQKIRAYIPFQGNLWNHITNEAFGNNEELDKKDCLIRYGIENHESIDRNFDEILAEIYQEFYAI